MLPDFYIGKIPVNGRVILAPMDGITDQPFRLLCKKMGSSLIISEFINASDVEQELNDFHLRTSFTEFERPFGFQIYGSEQKAINQAALRLQQLEPDFLDLNLGCSIRRIANRGAGAGLLKNPSKISKIINSLIRILDIPVTVKIRLGWDSSQINYREIAKIVESEGAQLISVHARRRDQSWKDPADWETIRIVKESVNIPVVGNGAIGCHDDIDHMLNETGCDGVMIGRASLGNPWLFSPDRKEELSQNEISTVIIHHWQLMQTFFGAIEANIRFRKHLKAYVTCHQYASLDIHKIMHSTNPTREFIRYLH